MRVTGRHVVVTGAASGIGRALAERFAAEGARAVVVADLDEQWATKVAAGISAAGTAALGVGCDVADAAAIDRLVSGAEAAFGPVEVFCSNAGFSDPAPGDLSAAPEAFRRIVEVNLLSHVWAAQRVVPAMVERGEGYLLQTISSAALITGPSGPGYTLSKHGALGFAEWLSLNYGDRGICVSCLCPNAVYTGMFGRARGDTKSRPPADSPIGDILLPEDVAQMVVEAMEREQFLILPHPRVGQSFLRKATDYDGWLDGTRRRLRRLASVSPDPAPSAPH